MDTQTQNNLGDTVTSVADKLRARLDAAWGKVVQEKALDFFKRAVSPATTIGELMKILAYDKVDLNKLSGVSIGEIVRATSGNGNKAATPTPHEPRIRTSGEDIEREESEILTMLKDNPGIGRDDIGRKVRGRLTNKSMAHVSYLLRRLVEQGRVSKSGERRGTVYEVKATQ
jgi:hypothetical protein